MRHMRMRIVAKRRVEGVDGCKEDSDMMMDFLNLKENI